MGKGVGISQTVQKYLRLVDQVLLFYLLYSPYIK